MDKLAEYVSKTAALAVTHQCTHQCHQDSHRQVHEGTLYAEGEPPRGYWEKLRRLAARYGYTLQRSYLPTGLNGEGCSGFTVGYLPPEARWEHPEVSQFAIYVQVGLTPATEFFVVVHELTHAILKHPTQSAADLDRVMAKRQGEKECPDQELQCHFAGVAVAKQHGVRIRKSAVCYLQDRVKHARYRPTLRDQQEALRAARVISSALSSVSYARAA